MRRRKGRPLHHLCAEKGAGRIVADTVAVRALLLLFACAVASRADAHPAPFSYLDLRIGETAIDGSLVLHVIDVAHELKVDPPEQLLDPRVAQAARDSI